LEIVEHGEEPTAVAAAAIALTGMLFYAGGADEGAPIGRTALKRLPTGDPRATGSAPASCARSTETGLNA
jgi:hypothetical protein